MSTLEKYLIAVNIIGFLMYFINFLLYKFTIYNFNCVFILFNDTILNLLVFFKIKIYYYQINQI